MQQFRSADHRPVVGRSEDPANRLQAGGQLGALPDGALGVELGRSRRPADDVRVNTLAAQLILEVADRVLAGADHHVVHGQHLGIPALGTEADVKSVIVDSFVVHPGKLPHTFGFQRGAMHPTGCLTQPSTLRALAALQQDSSREAALITFLVTLSGVVIAGIGSAVWGVVAGAIALFVQQYGARKTAP